MSDITVTTTEGGVTVVTDRLGAATAAAAAAVSAAAAATSASNASTSASNAASSASAASTSANTATTQAGNASTSASAASSSASAAAGSASAASTSASNAATSASAASTSASNAATSASEAAASAAFLNPAAVAITGGTINGTPIGGSTPAAGAFTTLSATGTITTGERLLTAGTQLLLGKGTNNALRVIPNADAVGVQLGGTDYTGSGAYKPLQLVGSIITLTPTVVANGIALEGPLVISHANAGQIKFPATQNASADANTLDDYEEGTWTPSDVSGAGLSFSSVSGHYTKIGRMVFAGFAFTYPATADATGVVVGGLPFTNGTAAASDGSLISYTDAGIAVTTIVAASNTQLNIRNAATGGQLANSALSGKTIRGVAVYRV